MTITRKCERCGTHYFNIQNRLCIECGYALAFKITVAVIVVIIAVMVLVRWWVYDAAS